MSLIMYDDLCMSKILHLSLLRDLSEISRGVEIFSEAMKIK